MFLGIIISSLLVRTHSSFVPAADCKFNVLITPPHGAVESNIQKNRMATLRFYDIAVPNLLRWNQDTSVGRSIVIPVADHHNPTEPGCLKYFTIDLPV